MSATLITITLAFYIISVCGVYRLGGIEARTGMKHKEAFRWAAGL